MKIWVISDTHGSHFLLDTPTDVDMVIHCGDCTDNFNYYTNKEEFFSFLNWYENLDIKHKVLIAGNHDQWVENEDCIKELNSTDIHYLDNEYLTIENLKLYGSPNTYQFGSRYITHAIDKKELETSWDNLDDSIDILITHLPPFGILDMVSNASGNYRELCGCKGLLDTVRRIKPKLHCFGHIHNDSITINQGIRVIDNITFVNASCVTNGISFKMEISNGIIINI